MKQTPGREENHGKNVIGLDLNICWSGFFFSDLATLPPACAVTCPRASVTSSKYFFFIYFHKFSVKISLNTIIVISSCLPFVYSKVMFSRVPGLWFVCEWNLFVFGVPSWSHCSTPHTIRTKLLNLWMFYHYFCGLSHFENLRRF